MNAVVEYGKTLLVLLVLVAIGVAIVCGGIKVNDRKLVKHTSAIPLVNDYVSGKIDNVEVYFSHRLGTVLVLFGVPNSTNWCGIVYRVTEDFGRKFLNEPYMVTAFIANRQYWGTWSPGGASGVIGRDGYIPIYAIPTNLQRYLEDL